MAAVNELEMLEKLHMRLAHINTDDKLEAQLDKLLTPVLVRVASDDEPVRRKALEIVSYLLKVVKSRPNIKLPVSTLLQQMSDDDVKPMVKNFNKIFLSCGVTRLSDDQLAPLMPQLMRAIHNRTADQKYGLLQLSLGGVQHIMPQLEQLKPDQPLAQYLRLDDPQTAAFVLQFYRDVILLPHAAKAAAPLPQSATTAGASSEAAPTLPPPGLSNNAVKAIGTAASLDTVAKLVQVKRAVLKFVTESGLFTPQQVFPVALAALGDADEKVAQAADTCVRHRIGTEVINTEPCIQAMFDLFLGTADETSMAVDERRQPLGPRFRCQLITIMQRCSLAASTYPGALKVFMTSLFSEQTSPRLQVLGLQFLHSMLEHTSDRILGTLGKMLLSTLQTKLIDVPGTPSDLLRLAYPALGKLSRRNPALFHDNFEIMSSLFRTAAEAESSVERSSAQEALSFMKDAFRSPTDPTAADAIVSLLSDFVKSEQAHCRQLAVQYAVALFPKTHMASRFVCLLATGDDNVDIAENARRGVQPLAADQTSTSTDDSGAPLLDTLPSFEVAVRFVYQQSQQRLGAHAEAEPFSSSVSPLPFFSPVYSSIITFLRHCLGCSAGVHHDEETHVKVTSQVGARLPAIGAFLHDLHNKDKASNEGLSAVEQYHHIIQRAVAVAASGVLQAEALMALCELVASTKELFAGFYARRFDVLRSYVTSTRQETREAACLLTGLVSSELDPKLLLEFVQELLTMLKRAQESSLLESLHGGLCALGYILGATQQQKQQQLLAPEVAQQALQVLVDALSLKDETVVITALKALGESARRGPFPVPLGAETEGPAGGSGARLTRRGVLLRCLELGTNLIRAENYRVKEASAQAVGLCCAGEFPHPHAEQAIEGLASFAVVKSMEVQFAVGSALCSASLGPDSSAAVDEWHPATQQQEVTPEHAERSKALVDKVFGVIFGDYVKHTAAAARQASGVWLLTFLRNAGHHPLVQANLTRMQEAFTNLLSESDENTQDIASKGLGIVYELGDEDVRAQLVQVLVGTLTDGRRGLSQKFAEGSEDAVFSDGALGETKDGGKLTTYKELCSLANDLNQPDLIYKFMHLASHNSLWNSRKGAAFGFGKIAAKAKEQLEPHLPTLVPRLYRYQYDPNGSVRTAMTNIWKTLCPDPTATVDKYFSEILTDLMDNVTNKQWRQREACAQAMIDVLRGRTWEELKPHVSRLFMLAFRVVDDIKESVRAAGINLCKRLGKTAIQLCESDNPQRRTEATSTILPELIQNGLLSQVEDVRALSLGIILEVAKKAGDALRPHVVTLVGTLLEALSGLESPLLNYFSARLDSTGDTDILEDARLAASRGSPLTACLDDCVKYADGEVLPKLVPRLIELMKKGLGTATKGGCARFASMLVKTHREAVQPYISQLLKAMLNVCASRNAPLRKDYATSIAEVCKAADVETMGKCLARVQKMYMNKENNEKVLASAAICLALSQRAQDIFRQHSAEILPIAFLGMHDNEAELQKAWSTVWTEHTSGNEGGVRLYLDEIVELCLPGLEERDWAYKKQAGAAVAAFAKHAKNSDALAKHAEKLIKALLEALKGRTWEGKEALVEAVVSVACACDAWLRKQPALLEQVVVDVARECSKKAKAYKLKTLLHMAVLLDKFPDAMPVTQVWDLVKPCLGSSEGGDGSSDEDEEDRRVAAAAKVARSEEFQLVALSIVTAIWPDDPAKLVEATNLLWSHVFKLLETATWKVRVAALTCTAKLFAKLPLQGGMSAEAVDIVTQALPALKTCLEDSKYSATRKEAVVAITALVDRALEASVGAGTRKQVAGLLTTISLQDILRTLRGDGAVPVRDVASKLETKLATLSAA